MYLVLEYRDWNQIMAPTLRELIAAWREDPETEGEPTFLVAVTDGERVTEKIEGTGAEVLKSIGYDYLRVKGSDESMQEVSELSVVESVEIEGEASTQDSGNFRSRLGLRR